MAETPDDDHHRIASAITRLDESWLRTLRLLVAGERCVTGIAKATGERVSAVSSRLRWLRIDGLVTRRRAGRHVYYAIADPRTVALLEDTSPTGRQDDFVTRTGAAAHPSKHAALEYPRR